MSAAWTSPKAGIPVPAASDDLRDRFAAEVQRANELRQQVAAGAAALAGAEEEIARAHEQLAARSGGGAVAYRRVAADARRIAQFARETQRRYTD